MKIWVRNLPFVVSALTFTAVSIQAHAGITGTDPRPPQSSVVVAGITGTDPRPPQSSVVVAGITGTDLRPPQSSVVVAA